MNTGAWLRASFPAWARSCTKAAEWPIRLRSADAAPCSTGSTACSLSACCTSSRKALSSTGLVTKSKAPSLSARIAVSMLPKAVITATGRPGRSVWMYSTSSSPSPSGRRMSVRHSR
jgi:hypothetical protein